MKFFGNNSKIEINGQTFVGKMITYLNGQVIVDGKVQGEVEEEKEKVTIQVLANVERIESDEAINIVGNVTGNVYAKRNVNCKNIEGDVTAGGNVNADDINGRTQAGGNVNCDDITGNAQAGGTINCDDIGGNATAMKINY